MKNSNNDKDRLLVRISSWFFVNWRYTFLLWMTTLIAGFATYGWIIHREGFPSIQFPLTVVNGTYFVDDVNRVDAEVGKPLADKVSAMPEVSTATMNVGGNFFSLVVQFKDSINPQQGTKLLKDTVALAALPPQAQINFTTIDPAAFLNKYDVLVSLYNDDPNARASDLQTAADKVVSQLQNDELVESAAVEPLIRSGVNPATQQTEQRQIAYNTIGVLENGNIRFRPSITIGLDRKRDKVDILDFSKHLQEKTLPALKLEDLGKGYGIDLSGDFAEQINTQIDSLQLNLRDGLIAVALVSFLFITWRASVITGITMVSVIAVVIGILHIVGYSLNTITLFALVLSLGLFVDDATIVVEALDANRKRKQSSLEIVKTTIRGVGTASLAGTFTTVLVFLPLVFVSGVLGEFIRLMPITIILAMLVSLALSLTLIPLLSRRLLLQANARKNSAIDKFNIVVIFERIASQFAASLPQMLSSSKRTKGRLVAVSMVILSLVSIFSAGFYARKVAFNIFPSSKDSDQIGFQITFPDGYTIAQAQEATATLNAVINRELDGEVRKVTYGTSSQPNERTADAGIELVSYRERERKSPEMITALQRGFNDAVDPAVSVRVIQLDAGPPVEEFPFRVQIYEDDKSKAMVLATQLRDYLQGATVTRPNGTTGKITRVRLPSDASVTRKDGKRVFEVQAAFDASDTSALVVAAENYTKEAFTDDRLRSLGFDPANIGFDYGQESQNADSFKSLGIVFPLALALIYILLVFQFRSLIQPLLIFIAIPFSLLGVFAGLYYTDNSISFFSMLGLIGLTGISVNNTILLTDFANQERKLGKGPVESISRAVKKRFRPLITTTLTTVFALLPLALSDPFWEALAFTLMFGLLSSTLLVIFAFPYYYLAVEWLRSKVRPRTWRRARARE